MAAERTWDFFVSYTQADRSWAEWIAWILEEDGHKVLIQAWDFVPGSNWIQSMQDGATNAARTIAVLSNAYLNSVYGSAEWQTTWAEDPAGAERRLLPVRVQDCPRPGFLKGVVGVDVFGKDEATAKSTLRRMIDGAMAGRAKPESAPAFPGSGRAVTRPAKFPGTLPAVWKVAARNPNFIGRDTELDALAKELSTGSKVTVHSLHGLGGVGKTQLAIEYAHTHASDYDVVWSITAEDSATIPDQFAALARKLGLHPPTDPDEVREQVHDTLRTTTGWLLIFDNASSVPDIQPWLPTFPTHTPGHVIVTTRRGGFSSLGHVLDLDVIDQPAAVKLLQARVPTLAPDIGAQLAEQLGRLPLGLEQAAAYLDRTQTPAEDYLDLLRTAPHTDENLRSLVTVWTLSLDRVTEDALDAMQLLNICAYLAPEAIPLDLFTNHPDELPAPLSETVTNKAAFNKALATLVDFSLAKRTPTELQLHRLVQAAIRTRHRVNP